MERLVDAALARRGVVLLVFFGALLLGGGALINLPVDAFPDTSAVQVQINTSAPSLNGEEIEQQITLPVEMALGGLPGLVEVRSVSKFGLSQVVATFTDDTDVYDARQFVLERLGSVNLPEGIDPPTLGPISTGLGEIFAVILRSRSGETSLLELRTLHDWVLKPELLKTSGVAEINAWGGFEKQYHVVASPEKLRLYGFTLPDLYDALRENNLNVGGGVLESAGESVLIHGRGRVHNVNDIAGIVLRAEAGVPVRIGDVADVRIGHEIRRGAVTAQGEGEAVLSLGYMLLGENTQQVAADLRERLELAKQALPDDVVVEIVYDRTELVHYVLETARENLMLGALLVGAVLFFIMGSVRAGLIVAITIPTAMLCAAFGMYHLGIAATLLSVGAIDFGILVDGAVVMTDSHLRNLQNRRGKNEKLSWAERFSAVAAGSREVIRPVVFGMGIITVVFIPVLTLEGAEGKMFQPMAITFILALAGALFFAVFVVPVLSYALLPDKPPKRQRIFQAGLSVYDKSLSVALRWRGFVLGAVCVAAAFTIVIATRLGGEFIPRLSEGAFAINVIRLPGTSLEESVAYNTRMEKILLESYPDEIEHVWSRIGSAEVATDPMGIELSDIFITLKPRDQWTAAENQTELAAAMEETLSQLPGQNFAFSQPIEMRMNELSSGIRSDIAVKIIGDDLDELVRLANDVQEVLLDVQGAADISADQVQGLPTLIVDVNRDALARLGVPASEVLGFVEALGNKTVGQVYEGQRFFPLAVRLPDPMRKDAERLKDTIVPLSSGAEMPLHELARVEQTEGLANINREWSRRLIRVQVNVRDRDISTFLDEAQQRIAAEVDLPDGYLIEWGGQFENLQRAQRRLMVAVPLALALIFILLYFSLNRFRDVFIVYTGIPLAFMGGVLALWYRDIPFSVSAAIGFIALSGIAVLDGQVMIGAIRARHDQGFPLWEAVRDGARERFRPVLATSITDALGFLPMALSTGVGAEVQRPLATVVVAGVISCTILTLGVLPVLYFMLAPQTPARKDALETAEAAES